MLEEILNRGVNESTNSGHPTLAETNPNIGCNSELHHRHPDQANSTKPSRACYHYDVGNPCGHGELATGGMELDDFQEGFCHRMRVL